MSSETRPVRPPRAGTSNGQWALDGPDPLNANEVFKAADNPLNVRDRIEKVYSREGFASIPTDDLHGRFRWMGLYTQRKPGIDGGRTGSLEPHELEDEFFMMRVRIDGGALSAEQVRVIGEISRDHARDTADISDRQNVQLHWVAVEDVPRIWERLESVGLETTEACGDCPRVILGSPLAGVAADEIVDPTPIIEEIRTRYIGDPSLSNLPRKYKTAITGHPSLDVVHEINDISLVGVRHPQLGPGFDLWVGGGLSTSPRLAERLGAFVSPERAVEVWYAVTCLFRDYGFRRLRNKARLKFLLAEWGPVKFREVLEREYLTEPLPDGPAPVAGSTPGDHVGVQAQKDGRFAVGAAPTVGRFSGTRLVALADLMADLGTNRLRLTPHQKLVLLDIAEDRVEDAKHGLAALGLQVEPSAIRRGTMACTGIEYCKLAIVETKQTAMDTVDALEPRLAGLGLDRPISLHLNGCPNSCARIQTADIGLKGQLLTGEDGVQSPGYQVHLGGGLAADDRDEAGLGRTVRGLKVTAEELPDYVERLLTRYAAQREDDESFAHWSHRAQEAELR